MSEQIILSASDVQAIGGDPQNLVAIDTGPATAILPVALIDGTWALSPAALPSATEAQQTYLAQLPTRDVDSGEFQWVVDAAARAADKVPP